MKNPTMEQIASFMPPTRDVLEAEADVIAAHSNFDAAVIKFCDGLTRFQARVRSLKVRPVDTQSWAIAALVIALDAMRPTGASAAEVVRLCQLGQVAGPSAARNNINALSVMGLIEMQRSSTDRRRLQLRPTEQCLNILRESLTIRLQALEMVRPLRASATAMAADRTVVIQYVTRNMQAFATSGFKLYDGFPEVSALMDRQGGYLTLLEMIARSRLVDGTVRSVVSPSLGAHRFDVSRTQIRKLLKVASAQGWLQVEDSGGQVRIALAAYLKLRRWISLEFAWTARLVA